MKRLREKESKIEGATAIRATAAAGEKIAFDLAFRDTLVRAVREDLVVGERSTLKETRNENVFFRMYAGKSKNPEPTIVRASASTVSRTMLNGPFG